ncbi:PAS domain-containing sensor histidine kinase [Thalassotalea sp. G2M2-11]|uniref:PAS domain-containing sensor histidine kinase n=1 Tax=Thalassotalea sp. G2M2-11 TaxID=2787627 RepID=UPI0019D04DBA|nr:PAS domain-containing sensor histidine kinase [Thalassotalea sp. G2M2-11]
MTEKKFSEKKTIFFCLLLCSLIFAIDLNIPLGVAAGVPYVTVVLLSLKLKNSNLTVAFAILCILLTVLGYFLSVELGIQWMVLSNRALAIFVILVTAILGIRLKKTKSKLDERIEQFHVLTEQSPIMLWQANKLGHWTFVSRGWTAFTGNDANRELNIGWLESIHPKERALVEYTYQKLVDNAHPFQLSCRLKSQNNEYRWITLQGNACYSSQQEVTGFLGTAVDINDSKETELLLEEARQKYYHQEKMASLGTLASGILHEIGNPLASIIGLLNEVQVVIKSEPLTAKDKTKIDNFLTMIFTELNRLTRISQDVSSFSNMTSGGDNFINLNDLIERTCRLVLHDERMWQIKLTIDLDKNIPAIKLADDRFIQVLQNLISNAMDACEQDTTNASIKVSSTVKDNNIIISVKDNGKGMSPHILAQAGQEFFTTKPKGTGLGLSICYSLVNKMDGQLSVASKEGEGSEFTITLPTSANG